jgi:CcmD family protein
MSDQGYLFLAFLLVWGGVALYQWRIASLRQELARRVKRLEEALRSPAREGERP